MLSLAFFMDSTKDIGTNFVSATGILFLSNKVFSLSSCLLCLDTTLFFNVRMIHRLLLSGLTNNNGNNKHSSTIYQVQGLHRKWVKKQPISKEKLQKAWEHLKIIPRKLMWCKTFPQYCTVVLDFSLGVVTYNTYTTPIKLQYKYKCTWTQL